MKMLNVFDPFGLWDYLKTSDKFHKTYTNFLSRNAKKVVSLHDFAAVSAPEPYDSTNKSRIQTLFEKAYPEIRMDLAGMLVQSFGTACVIPKESAAIASLENDKKMTDWFTKIYGRKIDESRMRGLSDGQTDDPMVAKSIDERTVDVFRGDSYGADSGFLWPAMLSGTFARSDVVQHRLFKHSKFFDVDTAVYEELENYMKDLDALLDYTELLQPIDEIEPVVV